MVSQHSYECENGWQQMDNYQYARPTESLSKNNVFTGEPTAQNLVHFPDCQSVANGLAITFPGEK